jgi:DNA gyrase/topoisomerase IV subunit B
VNRNKGLGEQSPDELAYCLLRPATRNVKTITVQDFSAADEMLEMAFGTSVDVRRKYLLDHISDLEER